MHTLALHFKCALRSRNRNNGIIWLFVIHDLHIEDNLNALRLSVCDYPVPNLILCLINRIMVGMPSVENREKILRTLLAKEKVDKELGFKELATMTEGYSGSDLKVLNIY